MLSKFETKSNRVKGVAFHPKRPWVLASLHNGAIQLWDYKMGTLVESFNEHEGPVRGVAFHTTQPLFVSGGDDYKIKVWNWKLRKCLFTMEGHNDYVRTVFFHHEHPWILSASDDQTIRIWNWQSRHCISILTGHNHYVMCAQWHPKEDLIVSASLDQTVRVWDYTGLRKKHAPSSTASPKPGGPELFGSTDAVVKYVLEGHERGVNWATFHPTLPFIASCGDDRQIKIWRMTEMKAWELDTCRGHFGNVSSVVFHPHQELIISNGEDRTIRLWNLNTRATVMTFRRENDRFWIVAAHPELNLFAAGHDNGLIVFKLERERPAHAMSGNLVYFFKSNQLMASQLRPPQQPGAIPTAAEPTNVYALQRPRLAAPPRRLSYNPADESCLVQVDENTYHFLNCKRAGGASQAAAPDVAEKFQGQAQAAIFVARNRFVTLNRKQNSLTLRDLKNDPFKTMTLPFAGAENIFFAGGKTLLVTTATAVILFDLEIKAVLADLAVNNVRYIYPSADMSHFALMSKHTIVIVTRKLEQTCMIHETIKLKSGTWDPSGALVYATLNHIKYLLPNGDHGIIKTLEQPIYLLKSDATTILYLDRKPTIQTIRIDPTEYQFKLALTQRRYKTVLELINSNRLMGQSIIAYLQRKNYSQVALHFVKDPKTRFALAMDCGDMDVAVVAATTLDREDCWRQLAAEALRIGNIRIAELGYQHVHAFDKLAFLYAITGNLPKMRRLEQIAQTRGDVMSQANHAAFLGHVEADIPILQGAQQPALAYLTARAHGMEDVAAQLLAAAGRTETPDLTGLPEAPVLLQPPIPLMRLGDTNWPELPSQKRGFEGGQLVDDEPAPAAAMVTADLDADFGAAPGGAGDWAVPGAAAPPPTMGFDLNPADLPPMLGSDAPGTAAPGGAASSGGAPGWDLSVDELDLGDLPVPEAPPAGSAAAGAAQAADPDAALPAAGASPRDQWIRNSTVPAVHVAAGAFESAMQHLNRQLCIVQFEPLKPFFLMAYRATRLYCPGQLALPSIPLSANRSLQTGKPEDAGKPFLYYTLAAAEALCTAAYDLVSAGKFPDARTHFRRLLHQLLLTDVDGVPDGTVLAGRLVGVCREYLLGLEMEIAKRQLAPEGNAARILALSAYFSHCALEPRHLLLTLQQAMLAAGRARCWSVAGVVARRLLELNPRPQVAQQARQIMQYAERPDAKDEITIDHDAYTPFTICGASFTPIYRGQDVVHCAYCQTSYKPEFRNRVCTICQVAQVGQRGNGSALAKVLVPPTGT
ncbi:hypothetical protein CXG81DRAFT_9724 [Caulochytrium protostelioides]|uniref:Coatomer subunit alpha n=1 Tax=Caulochytrium protostelioides TaxID=1555241 RepID=A0A4P9XCU7_9FUNG|nr:hypothetical protein CXG81DRAFT_9724 [Caulochytrium protostelioides]|eukprot:RKP03275.1 hypothetical protein CXG81DRAFT_9724 [Caulochytrium protostelioides]